MFYVISYDVPADKRRHTIARLLEDYGTRVQYSVFEANLDEKQLTKLRRELKQLIDQSEDRVRLYGLCEACRQKAQVLGAGALTSDPDVYIV